MIIKLSSFNPILQAHFGALSPVGIVYDAVFSSIYKQNQRKKMSSSVFEIYGWNPEMKDAKAFSIGGEGLETRINIPPSPHSLIHKFLTHLSAIMENETAYGHFLVTRMNFGHYRGWGSTDPSRKACWTFSQGQAIKAYQPGSKFWEGKGMTCGLSWSHGWYEELPSEVVWRKMV